MDDTFDSAENAAIIIKQEEYENAQMEAISPLQPTSSSTLNLNDEEEQQGDDRNGLQFYANFATHIVDRLMEKIETDEKKGRSISVGMNLDENEENGAR